MVANMKYAETTYEEQEDKSSPTCHNTQLLGTDSQRPDLANINNLRLPPKLAIYESGHSLTSSRFSNGTYKLAVRHSIIAGSTLDLFHSQLETYAAKTASRLNLRPDNVEEELNYEVDTCYSWIVLLACSVLVLIAMIPLTISGILYLEFVDSFVGKEKTILWACSLAAALPYMLGPISALIIERTSARASAMIGCAGLGFSLWAMTLTTNFVLFFIMYSLLSSIFGSMTYIPAVTFAVHHFRKHRQTALILGSVSAAATFLVLPPIIAEILVYYSWREAALFAAALCMQGTVLAALMRLPAIIPPSHTSTDLSTSCYTSQGSLGSVIIKSSEPNLARSVLLKQHHAKSQLHQTEDCRSDALICSYQTVSSEREQTTWLSTLRADWAPLFHWRMISLMATAVVYGWNCGIYFVCVPFHVEKFGLTPEQTAEIYMVGALSGISTRVSCAFIGRFVDYDKAAVVCLGAMIGAACMTGFTITKTYIGFAVCCALQGVSQGILASLATPAILELHGEYRVELVFGLEMMFCGISVLVAPLLAEAVNEAVVTDFAGFAVSIGVSTAAALSPLPHLVLKYCHNKEATDHQLTKDVLTNRTNRYSHICISLETSAQELEFYRRSSKDQAS